MGWRRSSAAPRGSPAAPAAGTTVEVFLPRAALAETAGVAGEPHAVPAVSGGGTVLVVDDDPDVREIAAIFLREAGYAVKEAGSGPEGHDVLAAGPVCLALVDYAMPMMSGPEFVRLARSIHPRLPVIYVTGAADALGPDKIPPSDPIVMKPYTRARLLRWCANGRSRLQRIAESQRQATLPLRAGRPWRRPRRRRSAAAAGHRATPPPPR